MAICDWCSREMSDPAIATCTQRVEYPDGQVMDPVPFTYTGGWYDPGSGETSPRAEIPDDLRCHDCKVAKGGTHHPGCDTERCPRCGGQLISCGCLDRGEGER